MNKIVTFSLNDLEIIKEDLQEDENIDFAMARITFIGTSVDETENSQGYILSEEVLKKHAHTALGKFITGKINPYSKDLMSHMEDNDIFGYIPQNSEIAFMQEGTRWFAICDAVISKIYCKGVIDAFRYDNDRCVSIEASVETSPNNPKEIESFIIHSITILSKIIKGAVSGASMEIIKFSSEMAEKYYNNKDESPLKKFADTRKNDMKKPKHDPSVTEKSNDSQKKLGLYKEVDKEETMANNKETKKTDEEKVELAEENKDIIMGSDEEKEEETVEMECGDTAKLADTEPEKELETINKEPQDKKNHEEENKAKWSMSDVEGLLVDSSVKDVVVALFSGGDSIETLVANLITFAEEKEELQKEKAKSDKEKADVKFSQIMAMAKLKLSNEKYDEMHAKGETLKFSELDSFEKDVKACICDTVLFAKEIETDSNVSYGTHMTLTETKSNSLWN